jgi:hypothetical protein
MVLWVDSLFSIATGQSNIKIKNLVKKLKFCQKSFKKNLNNLKYWCLKPIN